MKHVGWFVLLAGCFGSHGDEVGETTSAAQVLKDKCKKHPKKKCIATTATVGVEGGTVTTEDGLVLDVPFGAVDDNTTITVTSTTLDPDPAIGGAGTVYAFEPEGLTFVRPIEVTLPLPAGMTDASVYWTKLGSPEFEAIGGTIEGATITASTYHFSLAVVGAPVISPAVRGKAWTTWINATDNRNSQPTGYPIDDIDAIVDDGAGSYLTIDAVFDPGDGPGTFRFAGVPTGGDYILRAGNDYLVTSSETPDLGISRNGRPDNLDHPLGETASLELAVGLVEWQQDTDPELLDGDQLELFSTEANAWAFESQRFSLAPIPSCEEPTTSCAGVDLSVPGWAMTGGPEPASRIRPSAGHHAFVAQLSVEQSANGVPYEAMKWIGEVSMPDMSADGPTFATVDVSTNIFQGNTIAWTFPGDQYRDMFQPPATLPGGFFDCTFCGGILGVLGQPHDADDGFYGANADMLLMFDREGAHLDTGVMQYGSPAALGGLWEPLALVRWTTIIQHQLPDTAGTGQGGFTGQSIDWVALPSTIANQLLSPPMSPVRNIVVDGMPGLDGSTTNLPVTPTISWDPPATIPMIPPPGGVGPDVPSPVLYTIRIKRMFVEDNLTRGELLPYKFSTQDTSFSFLPNTSLDDILVAGETYVFLIEAQAATTRASADRLLETPWRTSLDRVTVTISTNVFGDAHGTPPPPPIATPIAGEQSYPWGLVAGAQGVFWADRGDSPWDDPPQFTTTGRIWRAELDGSNPTVLVHGQATPNAVAVEGTNLYWLNQGDFSNGSVRMLDLSTCTAPPCEGTTLVVDEPGLWTATLLAVDGDLFWLGGGGLRVLRAGALVPDTLAPDGGVNAATDGVNIYWTDYGQGRVLSIPVGGGLAVPIATGGTSTWDVQTDGSFVYFSNQAWQQPFPANIQRVPVGGGTVETIATGLATDPDIGASEIMKVFGIDASHAYYVDLYDRLMRAPLDGSSPPENLGFLTEGGWCPQGKLSVHAGVAYWTDTCGQMVMRAVLP